MTLGGIMSIRLHQLSTFSVSYMIKCILPLFLLLVIHSKQVVADVQFNYKGCFQSTDLTSSLEEIGYYQYQSVNYCQESCGSSAVAALFDGSTCYCGNSASLLDSLTSLSESECDVDCNGWPYQMCGGSTAMNVYVNAEITADSTTSSQTSTSSSVSGSTTLMTSTRTSTTSATGISTGTSISSTISSSSLPSSSSGTSSSTGISSSTGSLSTSEKDPSSRSSTSVTSTQAQVSTYISVRYTTNVVIQSVIKTSNRPASTILVTATSIIATETANVATNNDTNNKTTNGSHKKLSGGAIAGIVIGVVFGVLFLILAVTLFYYFNRRNKKDDDLVVDLSENKQYQPYSYGEEEISPVVVPPTNTLTRDNTKHSMPPKAWGAVKSSRISSSSGSFQSNNASGNLLNEEPLPTTIVDENKIHSNIRDENPSNFTGMSSRGHTDTFEDPVTIYASENIFSATSLQDIGNDNQLRIVNPDDPEKPYES
ncbi:similar to Saccharomyces cerevisiae YOL105C WSC3 Partially redundant sensor-transducer of the stress-activated PKC1-MPK1 signaling pathway involved in maintenance of cell wall integrity [Maudiozyma saulgeensis]|uniref:Similar to Saccharomyces cerevisiae YOL105C WSC3 Partially redundant sensor-transducer of the stress-activated PKC1-MPK1 signaling pathway involved in maintenance of cell wall integrity n=1 Tax=Maudiozyma saulgeensis TaxID=1789683 RepID=A0A1X7R8F1_9SACH|nr:similar to Saccharomyces cerevisiae YOL105C WSC3 Partially redundant sensor-transducer of the stress-activated PKC1-MPK1 signaling pathway involved in maintenance of cell wall integrity [Kazachstania saulgeensis]